MTKKNESLSYFSCDDFAKFSLLLCAFRYWENTNMANNFEILYFSQIIYDLFAYYIRFEIYNLW